MEIQLCFLWSYHIISNRGSKNIKYIFRSAASVQYSWVGPSITNARFSNSKKALGMKSVIKAVILKYKTVDDELLAEEFGHS